MYYDFLVKIPENTGKISKNKRKDVTYIEYTYDRKYIPEKKYNVPLRTTIGKMDPSDPTMMYPNPNFEKYFPDVVLPDTEKDASRSSCIRVGAFLVIKKIIDDYKLQNYLSSWDDRGKGLLLDLAAYSIISENNAAQYYPDYAYNHPVLTPNHKIYSDSTISRFLSEISEDERIAFLNDWNEKRNHREKIYISYDSTNKNCKAGDVEKSDTVIQRKMSGLQSLIMRSLMTLRTRNRCYTKATLEVLLMFRSCSMYWRNFRDTDIKTLDLFWTEAISAEITSPLWINASMTL